jgi:hypothetical protein
MAGALDDLLAGLLETVFLATWGAVPLCSLCIRMGRLCREPVELNRDGVPETLMPGPRRDVRFPTVSVDALDDAEIDDNDQIVAWAVEDAGPEE